MEVKKRSHARTWRGGERATAQRAEPGPFGTWMVCTDGIRRRALNAHGLVIYPKYVRKYRGNVTAALAAYSFGALSGANLIRRARQYGMSRTDIEACCLAGLLHAVTSWIPRKGSLRARSVQYMYNELNQVLRKDVYPIRNTRRLPNDKFMPTGTKPAAREVSDRVIARLLDLTAPAYRLILSRRFGVLGHPEASYREIAEALKISEASAREYKRRALRQLRKAVADDPTLATELRDAALL